MSKPLTKEVMMSRSMLILFFATFFLGCIGPRKRPPLRFSPAQLPDAQLGESYEAKIAVLNARTPLCNGSIKSGKVPKGLSLEQRDRDLRIFGEPQEAGRFEFLISASCFGTNVSGQRGQHRLTLLVKQR